ncbi:phytoene/squalene synthase family protein [Gordonia sp. DT30]|uniref:phytoene/squalene synthase family protein n=1 Tax=unclassified Gordonia (in: high G+C Gram-positive bacteria) TaxID=2657482 RepID=UPI003CFB4D39
MRYRTTAGAHRLYDDVAEASADLVIRRYSSSFGLASRLLAGRERREIRNVYALARLADEIVDAPRPGHDPARLRSALDQLEAETVAALGTGTSTNLLVHAFARTARRVGIDASLTGPFFASMRTDLDHSVHDEQSLAAYIYGSAEVVGLMCLRVFVADLPGRDARYEALGDGARRLGAAFQKVNFLRDLGVDDGELGRRYLTGLDPRAPSAAAWRAWLDEIDADLAAAAAMIPELPRQSRVAVCVAHDLFADLSARLRRTPPEVAVTRRVRVPAPAKMRIAVAAVRRRGRPGTVDAVTR